MNTEIKEKMPNWCKDTETKYQLLMSDDLDALMCYTMQKMNYGREAEYFINSSKDKAYQNYTRTVRRNGKQYFYTTENANGNNKDMLALDFSINPNTKSWDNHVVDIRSTDNHNNLSANMNIALGINSSNYTKKACISSFITMLSYYNSDVQHWTHEEKIVLCCIDGLYQPFLPKNYKYKQVAEKNLKLLDMEFLIEFIKDNIKEIESFYNTYVIGKTIWVNKDGYLETNIDLDKLSEIFDCEIELPHKQFKLRKTIESEIFNVENGINKDKLEESKGKIFNIALTFTHTGVISYWN